ncbi:MAG: DUF1499 domain-containing protein [Gemmatimonadota bacterium]|nr:DUF1499 domain-containing protein [Gemmatimonadota bacterium]
MTDEAGVPAPTPAAPATWPRRLRPIAIAAFLCLPAGGLGTRLGLWSFGLGFGILAAGVLVGLVAGVVGLVVIVKQRRLPREVKTGGPEAAVVIAVAIILIFTPFVSTALRVPPIHQVSTDLVDPPTFRAISDLRGPDANPVVLTTDGADAQQAYYPWIRPMIVPVRADEAYEAALTVLKERMVLAIVASDPLERVIEATDTSFWFGFKDDFVVRVRFDQRGARVDVRSISRVGQGDLGVNADRVGRFFALLAEEIGYDPGPFESP